MVGMPGLRPVKARALLSALAKLGFRAVMQKGSHIFLRNDKGNTTVVPFHASDEIDRKLLRKILRDCNLREEEFIGGL